MSETTMDVRNATNNAMIIDVVGDVTPATEDQLLAAYGKCEHASTVVLNFTDLAYMNSGGIGLLVMVVVRAQRNGQSLRACGLSDHYRHIFELTRIDEAIRLYDSEQDAIAA